MFRSIKEYLSRFDYILITVLLCLISISFLAVYTASYDPLTETVSHYPAKQLKLGMVGLMMFFITGIIGYKRFVTIAPVFYVVGLVVLYMVLKNGTIEMGAQRWLQIGPVKVQPSELFKWVWAIMLAWVFSDLRDQRIGYIKFFTKLLWMIPPFLLVYKQPDLGTALTYFAAWGITVMFLGIRKSLLILVIVAGLISMPIAWGHMKPYQKERVLNFINPDKDASGAGYQAKQAKIAIGSGGIDGKGYLKGTQSHLKFMPERHTDFIFAVINEEFGLIGGVVIVLLFFVLILRIIYIATVFKEAQGKIVCIAVAGFIFFQFYVNVSMTMGMAPVVGVPLPFISYGGSAMITFVSMVGLVNSVHMTKTANRAL